MMDRSQIVLTQVGEDFTPFPYTPPGPIPNEIALEDCFKKMGMALGSLGVSNQLPGFGGVCTGMAAKDAASLAWACQLAKMNPVTRQRWIEFAVEPTWGWAKTAVVGIGAKTVITNDSSTVTNTARAIAKFGTVQAMNYPQMNLTNFSLDRARDMGFNGVLSWLNVVGNRLKPEVYHAEHPEQMRMALACDFSLFFSCSFNFTETDKLGMAKIIDITNIGGHALAVRGLVKKGPDGGECVAVSQSYGTKMFVMNGSKPPARFPQYGIGYVPMSFLEEHLKRRSCYAIGKFKISK